ncbi:PKD domain-containing protein, partial [Neobacillus drentensis]|uniref:PKD domain-containing protein n=1 Tax=Neobacillus drentensis TaxID=220684 RepID=UPI003000F4F4
MPSAQAGSQFLMWSEDGKTFASFGPNQEIRIHTGQIEFLKGCADGGADDFIEPFADIYVVPSGQGLPDEKLQDVSGSPNTVEGVHGGLFISEVIGYTTPGGKIGPGKYTVVYDECQDGKVSPEDKVFPDAFEVVFPTDMPDIMADPAIARAKAKAAEAQEWYESVHAAYKDFFAIQSKLGTVGKVWQCGGLKETAISVSTSFSLTLVCPKMGGGPLPGTTTSWDVQNSALFDGFFTGLTMGVEWATGVNPKQLALKQILSTASHYRGIAADPPNPDFQKLTPLDTRELLETESNDPETIAFVGIGNELGNEAPLLKAFLTSIEKYQGSAIEKNGDWSLIHARAVQDYAAQLKLQIARTNKAIEIAKNVLDADPRPLDQTATDLQAFRDEVAAQGFDPDFVRDLKNMGLTNSQISEMKTNLVADSFSFNKNGLLNQLDSLRTTNQSLSAAFEELAKNMNENWIAYLTAMPSVNDRAPIVNAGGPYSGPEGSTITFDGSASTSPSEIVKYEWDLDGDGAFDDATEAKPTFAYDRNTNKLVGLKVTNADGWSNIGYATVFIENSNHGPTITSMSPDRAETVVIAGDAKDFAIEATDPEGDQVQIEWYVDRVHVGTGSGFTYKPSDDKVGKHIIEAIVTDSSHRSGYETVSWPVSVLMPDNDGDKWNANVDCNDGDSTVNPGAKEKRGNGKDDDCNPETSDISLSPKALFYPDGLGKNVALFESGAKVEAFSSQYDSGHSAQLMLDTNLNSNPWATAQRDNQWVKISLADNKTYLIDRIQVMPRPGFPSQRVKDFEVAVSTTTLDDGAFKTVLKATTANNGTLQEFKLTQPVLAKYIMYRPLNSHGGDTVISTQQFKVKTSQVSTPTVTFANQSTDPENDIVSWEWNFGDNTPVSTEKNPTHVYAEPGTYTISLKATDEAGNTSSYSLDQIVQSADFAFLPKTPKEGEYVNFYNTSVGFDEGNIVSSTWKFGDGSSPFTTTAGTYDHIYRDNETYTITLETVDKNGKKQQVTKTITPVNVAPTVDVGRDITVRSEQKLTFSANIYDPGADAKTCRWDFGDGTTSDICTTSHTYPSLEKDAPDKVYTATLTVTDDDGGSTKDSKDITVRAVRDPKLVALYTFDNDFKDYSGNNNHGTPTGNMTFADGIKGKAAKFDGKSGIKVMDDDSLDLSTAFSFSMWLYKEDQGVGGWSPILSKGDTTEYGPYALLHDPSGVSPGVRLTGGSTTSPDHLFTTVKTNLKEWYLFTTTWDGSNVKFYVNETLVDTKPWNDVFKNDNGQLLIGYDPPGVTEYFRGLMDDFRAYNYSLSPAEITDLYNNRLPEDQEPPVTTAKITPENPNGTNGWYTKDASITLTAVDQDSGVEKTEYRINNGEWKVYTGAIPATENGPYTVEFHSIDKNGNIEGIKSISFKLDTTKPFTMANVVPGEPDGTNEWYKSPVSITLSPSDEGAGV